MAVLRRPTPALRMLWSLDRDGWVALAGFLVGGSRLAPPPGLPTLRSFQLG